MTKKVIKLLFWAPRVMSILLILFLAMFSLDVFDNTNASAAELAFGLLMHNIPSLFLLGVLIISWKYEIVGCVTYILAGLAFFIFSAVRYSAVEIDTSISEMLFPTLVSVFAVIIGVLFFMNWRQKKVR